VKEDIRLAFSVFQTES